MTVDDSGDVFKKGIVIDSFCGRDFKIQLEEGICVGAVLAGKLRKHTKVIKGDEVMVRLTHYNNFTNGMITERLTKIPVENVVHKKRFTQRKRIKGRKSLKKL